MNEKAENIRNLIGDGETEAALEALDALAAEAQSPLRDDALVLRGRFKKWDREKKLGLQPAESEQNAVVLAALDLLKQLEKGPQKAAFGPNSESNFQPNFQPKPPAEAVWSGRFFIDGDPFEYYLNPQNQIFRIDPATRQAVQIAARFPSNDPRFAWAYFVPAINAWASVDHQGSIWTINFYGAVVRIGYFQAA